MSCFIRHSRVGFSSSPTMNSSSVMPSSAMPSLRFGVADQPQHLRPDHRARDQIAQRRAQPEPAEQQHEHQPEAEQRPRRRAAATCVRVLHHAASPRASRACAAASAAASNASRIEAWRALCGERGAEDVEPRPVGRARPRRASHAVSASRAAASSAGVRPITCRREQRRRRLPQRAGAHQQPDRRARARRRRASTSTVTRLPQIGERFSARRHRLGQPLVMRDRRREPQDLGVVERARSSRRSLAIASADVDRPSRRCRCAEHRLPAAAAVDEVGDPRAGRVEQRIGPRLSSSSPAAASARRPSCRSPAPPAGSARLARISPFSAPKPKPSARSTGPRIDVRVRLPIALATIRPPK